MSVDIDEALLQMRRNLEWTGIICRSVSVLWIISAYVLLPTPAAALASGTAWLTATALALPEVAINGFAVYALRNVADRRYPRMSAALVAVDTATIIATVVVTTRDPEVDLWPLFIIPIIVAAYRHQLAGALLAFAATAGACLMLYFQGPLLAGRATGDELVVIAPALLLMVALMTGLLSRAHHTHLRQLATARTTLRQQALYDPLTGLGNRNLLHEHSRTTLSPGTLVSVLVLDLDGFKSVNDTLGHAAGDELLRVVAGRLRTQAREGDLVARLGGDEFTVMLHDTDTRTAREIAERLRRAVMAPILLEGEQVSIDASIGVATAVDDSLDNLLRAADADMYRVKSAHHILRSSPEPLREAA
ncbi:hypothetical protein GCM10010399_68350 [Dactylosporangium fulvum]|uniref:GGDEF domain-containing protein n=1 Tax=Dactylosporangium fulvum TaxID=53359 RepID=A0ABY5W9B0_9ACTN|nr:GGDEF domain-containing protein [Dactylosporangium fulvum]UWP84656.1 GGDEF domain-containing protein [Dactylosporangium fulvum]